MDRSWIIVAGMVLAVPLGVVIALGLDFLPLGTSAEPEDGTGVAVQLVHVIDGDTLIVEREAGEDERVRVLGIDTPEAAREGEPGERCAAEATALTEELTAGGDVTITPDPSQAETDRYGRTLAYVEVDGDDVGAALLEAGLAEVYRAAPDIERYAAYEELEAQAPDPACEGGS